MARDIVEETNCGIGIGYHTESRLEERDRDTPKKRIVVCKVFKFLPQTSPWGEKFLKEGRLKALCTIRDPRDIIVSMKSRGGARKKDGRKVGDFDFHLTASEFFPVWLGQLEQWIDLGPRITMMTKYEELIVNLYKEAKRIARHLEINADDDLLKTIAKRYTIQSQLDAKKKHQEARKKAMDEEENAPREDPWLPSVPAIKFGTSGHWRTWLSTGEVALVEKHNRGFMERFGYL